MPGGTAKISIVNVRYFNVESDIKLGQIQVWIVNVHVAQVIIVHIII